MAIKALDAACVEIHFALWHLRTVQSAAEIRDRLKAVLDVNDQLLVVDASNTRAAWLNLGKDASGSLRDLAP